MGEPVVSIAVKKSIRELRKSILRARRYVLSAIMEDGDSVKPSEGLRGTQCRIPPEGEYAILSLLLPERRN